MAKFLLSRLVQLVAVLLTVSFVCFAALNLLGDPLFNLFGPTLLEAESNPDVAAQVADAEAQFHLDDPLPVRYVKWLGDVSQGEFGRSYKTQQPVSTILADKLPLSILLMVLSQLVAIAIAIPWAVWAASRAGGPVDRGSTVVSFYIIALPNFCLAIIVYLFLNLRFGWFAPSIDSSFSLARQMWHMLPAAFALGLGLAAGYQRLLRTDLATTLQEDFVLMAKAKGMPPRNILWRHALRPSLFSFITVFAINTGSLIGGALVVERIFGINGMGEEIFVSIIRDDYPVVLPTVLLISAGFVVLNMFADLLYTVLDPRVRRD
jgi:peptide/nickel transport system permease protein